LKIDTGFYGEKMRTLRFTETPIGFYLEDPSVDEDKVLVGYYSLNPFPFQVDAEENSKEVVFFDFVFFDGDLMRQLDIEISYADEIPGLYTVPELGVKNATFKEVLEAVKKYYEAKLSQKPAHTA
jgi:hypothetical protein